MPTKFELNDIHLESTTLCSARCFMCPHDELNRKGEMDFELFKKIVDDAISLGCKRLTPFRIGEPLLFNELELWLDYLADKDLVISIFTNASHLTKEMGEMLLKYHNLLITISFHGYNKEMYEKNMGLSFELTKSNIISFMSANKGRIPTVILCLVENITDNEFLKFQDLWSGTIFSGISVRPYMEWSGRKSVMKTKLDLMREFPEKYKKVPCGFAMNHFDVMYDGKVCLCCVDYQGEVIFGDLSYQSIMDVYNGRLYQYYTEQHIKNGGSELPLCKECCINIVEVN